MKTYFKTIFRTIKTNALKFIALISIILVGVCFVTGVGGISPKVTDSFNDELKSHNAPDVILKSTSENGFSNEDIENIKNFSDTRIYTSCFSLDSTIDDKQTRLMNIDMESGVNKLTLISGTLPINKYDVVVEENSKDMDDISIGEVFAYKFNDYLSIDLNVVGIVKNPLIYSMDGEPTIEEGKDNTNLNRIFYLDSNLSELDSFLPITDIYVCLKSTNKINYFASKYLDKVNASVKIIRKINTNFAAGNCAILTMEDNKSYLVLTNITDKIDVIVNIFPIFFIVVVALVSLTTMSRLINEERGVIGCYISLGYSRSQIMFKYVSFSMLSTIIGSIGGMFTGAYILPNIVYELNKELKSTPASLLQVKAPKPGRKILLERMPLIWNHLKFKYKSTCRNIFRYVGRLLMVVISVAGSSALVMAGFGLYDVSKKDLVIGGITMNISSTLSPVAIIIVFFALLLCMLVLFNLTNMNIQERKREIATLEVLGYYNGEVYGYIFREIILMSLMGIIIGIPLGVGLLEFVFSYLDFGGLADVEWYSYLLAFGCSFLFILLISLMLTKKIKAIDMNESLKSIE